MPVRFEHLPYCCRRSLKRIVEVLKTGDCIELFLAVAPALSPMRPDDTVIHAIWGLGEGTWSWRRNKRFIGAAFNRIVLAQIGFVIEEELIAHSLGGIPSLRAQWALIRDELGTP